MSDKWSNLSKIGGRVVSVVAVMVMFYYISAVNFILFHSVVELLNIILSLSVFIVTKSTHKVARNNYFLLLGIFFLVIGIFNILHLFTYYGINIFNYHTLDMSVQFSIVSGLLVSICFMVYFMFLYKSYKPVRLRFCAVIFGFGTAILFLVVHYRVFPGTVVQGLENSVYKIYAQIIICLIWTIDIIFLKIKRVEIYKHISKRLLGALVMFALGDISHIFYTRIDDIVNVTSHILKFSGYLLVFRAIVRTTLENPYNLLFYRLTEINSSLEVKTRQLMKINDKLNDEINERKGIEQKLRDSKKDYQDLLGFLPYAVLVHSEGKVMYVNNATLSLLGYEEYMDMYDKDVSNFVHPNHINTVWEKMQVEYNNELVDFQELKMMKADGEAIDVETKAVPYYYKNKLSSLVVIADLTERKKAEEKEKALKEAIEYDKIKNEFMANISHELRTPLNVIYSAAQLIDYYSENDIICVNIDSIAKYSKSLKQNCYRMLRLVNNLIDLTKIDSGFLKLNLQNYNVISIVEEITLSVAQYIESKKINIQFDTEVEEKYIACDADMIERIILNLLSNAVKFTPEGGDIFVNIYDRGEYVQISVRDTGIGIPEDKREMIFDRFRQVDKSFVRKTEGSGIGLSLVKSIVELHKGQVYVQSDCGYGSEFIVKLPAVTVQYDNEMAATIEKQEGKVQNIQIEFSDIYS